MIFKGMSELIDKNEYRMKAWDRKKKYCDVNGQTFVGVGQLEWEILEALERIYCIHGNLPYVKVTEEGDASKTRKEAAPCYRIRSNKGETNYNIICPWGLPVVIGRYIGSVFDKPLSKERLEWMRKNGVDFPEYAKSIYDFPAFEEFKVCKKEISNYIRTMAIWFVSLHEFGHIINGHNDLMEAVNRNADSVTPEQRKALEIHADMVAAEFLAEIIASWQKYVGIKRIEVHPNGQNPGITYCDEISFAALAAYLSLRCFLTDKKWDEWTIGLHYGDRTTHPLLQLRLSIVFNCILRSLSEIAENETERRVFIQHFVNMVTQFEDFLFQNEELPEDKKLFFSPTELLRTRAGKEYYKRIFDALLELNDILDKYSKTLNKVEGEWVDYTTLPDTIFEI